MEARALGSSLEPYLSMDPVPHSPVCKASEADCVNLPWGGLHWLASSKIGNSKTMTFGRATIRAGCASQRHRHPNCDEILHVLSGRVEHTLENKRFILEAGDTISLPAGLWHGAKVLGDEDAEMIICFSSADRETEFAPGAE
jgi:quercetin dioxygenase-like cupin family protein